MSILRNVRGVLGMALTWGTVFGGVALLSMMGARAMGIPLPWPEQSTIPMVAARWGFIGAMGGSLFALTVLVEGRRRSLSEISSRRFGAVAFGVGALAPLLGAAVFSGAAVLATPGLLLSAIPVSLICGTLSGVVASISLETARAKLERHADRDEIARNPLMPAVFRKHADGE